MVIVIKFEGKKQRLQLSNSYFMRASQGQQTTLQRSTLTLNAKLWGRKSWNEIQIHFKASRSLFFLPNYFFRRRESVKIDSLRFKASRFFWGSIIDVMCVLSAKLARKVQNETTSTRRWDWLVKKKGNRHYLLWNNNVVIILLPLRRDASYYCIEPGSETEQKRKTKEYCRTRRWSGTAS